MHMAGSGAENDFGRFTLLADSTGAAFAIISVGE